MFIYVVFMICRWICKPIKIYTRRSRSCKGCRLSIWIKCIYTNRIICSSWSNRGIVILKSKCRSICIVCSIVIIWKIGSKIKTLSKNICCSFVCIFKINLVTVMLRRSSQYISRSRRLERPCS